MTQAPDHIEVFFVDNNSGWAAAEFDEDGNQLDLAVYHFHKRDALREARAMSGGIWPIHIFAKDGRRLPDAKAERKPSIADGKLTCQCCGRLIKANTGHIAKHGYRRPSDGWQTASCRGADVLPFEASSQGLAAYVLDLRYEVEQLEERIGKVERAEIKPYIRVTVRDTYGRRSTQRIWVDRDDFDAAKEEHKLRIYSIYSFEDLQAACIRLIEAELKAVKLELATQEARLEAWQGPSIKWDGAGWVAL